MPSRPSAATPIEAADPHLGDVQPTLRWRVLSTCLVERTMGRIQGIGTSAGVGQVLAALISALPLSRRISSGSGSREPHCVYVACGAAGTEEETPAVLCGTLPVVAAVSSQTRKEASVGTNLRLPQSAGKDIQDRGPRWNLVVAWSTGALSLVALPVGSAVSDVYLESRGFSIGGSAPAGIEMVAWLWFAAVLLVPVVAAIVFGIRAFRAGWRSATIPGLAGGLVGVMVLVVGLLTLRNVLAG